MDRYYRNSNSGGNQRRRYSRSRSRERNREQSFRRRNSRSRSRDRDRESRHQMYNRHQSQDLYRDIIEDDYHQDNRSNYNSRGGNFDNRSSNRSGRESDDRRDRDRERERERDRRDYRGDSNGGGSRHNNERRFNSVERAGSEDAERTVAQQQPTDTIFVSGLKPHITEADIMSTLIQADIPVSLIRLKRRQNTGASRGFAFVEFNSVEYAARWMELTQGTLVLPDKSRAQLQYEYRVQKWDWFCVKCGFSNFNHRFNCYKCDAPREESDAGTSEGQDEVSYIVTKKIMLRNLDVLTNEDGVLMAMQKHSPDLATKISKVLVSRDPLTQTSRGICYLHFESLVDSMNLRNVLTGLDPPLRIDDREILVSYCMDRENRELVPKINSSAASTTTAALDAVTPALAAPMGVSSAIVQQYTLADVPRLAEYSASLYATTPEEQAHYLQYYTEYYISEINKGNFGSLPTDSQMDEYSANSGAAVALSAMQRKQKKMDRIKTTATQAAQAAAQAAAAAKAALFAAQQQQQAATIVPPKGNDGKTYPTPDVSLYQYDETSGYYYDPSTGLYYDAHSQYYYNNETGAYLYWDQRKSSYVLATPAAVAATVQETVRQETTDEAAKSAGAKDEEQKKDKKDNEKHDKVKVAKKIVKDMEKWAKQLNQKKDYTTVATPQPILPAKGDESAPRPQVLADSYADVGFSILEKKERVKLTDYMPSSASAPVNKLISSYGSDSDDEKLGTAAGIKLTNAGCNGGYEASEKDYVDFQQLTCLLCKRAFQSADILQKHLKMSNLHKENLQKFNLARAANVATSDDSEPGFSGGASYRDRAKERRLKYGESDPPPNRTRERFENEIKNLVSRSTEAAPPMPISSSNVGNRLLQKMGWSEGQGLGRSNQGRTNIIETEARSSTAGLGVKGGLQGGNSYKTYIKKMMKSRYESV